MRISIIALAFLALGSSAESANAQGSAKQMRYAMVQCDSAGQRQSYCEIDTANGVRLKRDLSGNRCRLGQSWGYDERGIWVANGCSGEFEIGYPSSTGLGGSVYGQQGYGNNPGWGQQAQGYGQIVSCRSRNFQPQTCSVDTSHGVRLLNQTSLSACSEGQSWFADQRGITVTDGCGGEFEVGYTQNQIGYNNRYGSSGNYGQGAVQYLTCESHDRRQQQCAADLRYTTVEIARQLSGTPCTEGQSWGYDQRGIWVNGGCRAEFAVREIPQQNNAGGYGQNLIRCESRDSRQQYCNADARHGARLVNNLSRTQCVEGQNWGADSRGVWVSGGCRGEFELMSAPAYGSAGTLVCESVGSAQQYCAANTRGGVRLTRQLSRTACVQGQNWGYDSRGVWVSGGCRAEFDVSAANAFGNQANTVLCESVGAAQQYCAANTRGGVRLTRQLSRSACVQGQNWGYDSRGIWVSGGCRAEFTVGYK